MLKEHLTAENLKAEADYFARKESKSFERPYGWAWLLKLAEELHGWDDPDASVWSKNLRPLADVIVARYLEFFPKQTYPIRTGVHPNTAFGLAFAHDYARAVGDTRLAELVEERARAYFAADVDAPARWEPSGADFFSPSLMEADLMRRVLPPAEFRAWFARFLPGPAKGEPKALFTPATVTDRTDPQLVHLDGLNLSRAWCMRSIAAALPAGDPARAVLAASAADTPSRRWGTWRAATMPASTGWPRSPSTCSRPGRPIDRVYRPQAVSRRRTDAHPDDRRRVLRRRPGRVLRRPIRRRPAREGRRPPLALVDGVCCAGRDDQRAERLLLDRRGQGQAHLHRNGQVPRNAYLVEFDPATKAMKVVVDAQKEIGTPRRVRRAVQDPHPQQRRRQRPHLLRHQAGLSQGGEKRTDYPRRLPDGLRPGHRSHAGLPDPCPPSRDHQRHARRVARRGLHLDWLR